MIKIHYRFLVTKRLEAIIIGLVVVMLVFFLAISEYKEETSVLLYYQPQYMQEYLLLSTTVVKMVVLMFMVFLWIHATRINQYDVYLLLREKEETVMASKYVVILGVSLIVAFVISTFMWGVFFLYPFGVAFDTILGWYGSVLIFVVYYTTMFMWIERWYEPVFGLVVPFIGWFVGMMTVDMFSVNSDSVFGINYSQLIVPDIVYDNNEFTLMFGPYIVLAVAFLWIVIVFHIVKKKGVLYLS